MIKQFFQNLFRTKEVTEPTEVVNLEPLSWLDWDDVEDTQVSFREPEKTEVMDRETTPVMDRKSYKGDK